MKFFTTAHSEYGSKRDKSGNLKGTGLQSDFNLVKTSRGGYLNDAVEQDCVQFGLLSESDQIESKAFAFATAAAVILRSAYRAISITLSCPSRGRTVVVAFPSTSYSFSTT